MTYRENLPRHVGEQETSLRLVSSTRELRYRGYESDDAQEDTISLMDVIHVIHRNLFLGVLVVPLAVLGSILIATSITPGFKSSSVIQIQSSYFRGPLVSDLIPEEHDHGELMSRRAALVQIALDDDFLLSLYQVYPELLKEVGFPDGNFDEENSRDRALALASMRNRFASYSLGGSTQQISATASTAELSQALSERFVAQILQTMKREREGLLLSAREAIAGHVRGLAEQLRAIEDSVRNTDERGLKDQLARARADIEALLVNYTERHPKVFRLKQQASSLSNRLKALQAAHLGQPEGEMPLSEAAKEPTQDVYNELLKKLSYLQIALSLEQKESEQHVQIVESPVFPLAPFFPNKKLFALLGLVIGMAIWIAWATVREISRISPVLSGAESLADRSRVLYLGKMPEHFEDIEGENLLSYGTDTSSPTVVSTI